MSNGETREQTAVREGLETYAKAAAELEHYRSQCESWERAHEKVEHENQMLREQIRELDHKAGFYMRYSTELLTKLQTMRPHADMFGKIIDETLRAAKDAAYKPTNAAPAMPQQQIGQGQRDDGEPAPEFLKLDHIAEKIEKKEKK